MGLEECMSHKEILQIVSSEVYKILDKDKTDNNGTLTDSGEKLENSFIFFIMNISKDSMITISEDLCQYIIIKQL